MNTPPYPVRINKLLVRQGVASRRKADALVKEGHVLVNGKPAELGQLVNEKDTVTVSSEALKRKENRTYLVFNKPPGIVSHSPQDDQREVMDFLPPIPDLAVIGRLDRNSRGLILASDDGLIVERLLNPRFKHEKEYHVTVTKRVTPMFVRAMSEGVHIGAHTTRRCFVEKIDTTSFRIVLTEGKKHQIRRMCDALGYAVADLVRVRIGPIHLGNLKEGQFRKLTTGEQKELFSSLGKR